jgi:hypothetical protein
LIGSTFTQKFLEFRELTPKLLLLNTIAGFEIFGAHRCGASTSAVRTGAHQENVFCLRTAPHQENLFCSRTAPHRHQTKNLGHQGAPIEFFGANY